jgi:hypothetical protein
MKTLVWRGLDEPRMEIAYRYRSGSFEAELDFDADGFVTLYHDFLERVG